MMAYVIYLPSLLIVTWWTGCLSQTRVSLTAPLNPVEEGAVCALHCQVWSLESGQTVELYRTYEQRNTRLSVGDILADVDNRWFLAVRQLSDGSIVYFLSMTDVSRQDKGNYSCKVIRTFPTINEVAVETVHIDVLYSPEDSDPFCSPDFDTPPVVLEGTRTTINCSSDLGNPVVKLKWSKAGKESSLSSVTSISKERVFSSLTFTPSMKDNGVVFLCQIWSPYHFESSHSCHVGPFTVLSNPDREYVQQEATSTVFNLQKRITSKTNDEYPKRAITPEECLADCSLLSRPVIYWVIGTVFTSIIAFTFLLIASILFFKLCHMSSNNNIDYSLPRKPAEELYVEVDCKRDDGRMYMALQKSENMMLRHDVK